MYRALVKVGTHDGYRWHNAVPEQPLENLRSCLLCAFNHHLLKSMIHLLTKHLALGCLAGYCYCHQYYFCQRGSFFLWYL